MLCSLTVELDGTSRKNNDILFDINIDILFLLF